MEKKQQGTVMKTSHIHEYLFNITPPSSLSDGEWTRKSNKWKRKQVIYTISYPISPHPLHLVMEKGEETARNGNENK